MIILSCRGIVLDELIHVIQLEPCRALSKYLRNLAAITIIIYYYHHYIITIDIIKGSSERKFAPGLKEECYSTGFSEDKYIYKLGTNHYVKLEPNFKTSISLISQLSHHTLYRCPFSSHLNTACNRLYCVPSKSPNPPNVRM